MIKKNGRSHLAEEDALNHERTPHFPETIWKTSQVKALLNLSSAPKRLLKHEPWVSWLRRRGGTESVYQYMRTADLTPAERKLLDVLLKHPHSSAAVYAGTLNISERTYYYRLQDLLATVTQHLNAMPEARIPYPDPAEEIKPPPLPAPLTSYIGAEGAVNEVSNLLHHPDIRLITVTGPGGIGKTSLTLHTAHKMRLHFADGVHLVDLTSTNDASLIPEKIFKSLSLNDKHQQDPLQSLKAYLHTRHMLLLLDNFEHLLPAAPLITELLHAASQLKIVVTSREILRLYGEHIFIVPPLALPELREPFIPERIMDYAAVRLFVERALAVNPAFQLTPRNAEALARLCHRLDGIPLAIELAAARCKLLSPEQILAEPLLFPDRHEDEATAGTQKTLSNIIEWNYRLLNEDEQRLFRKLAVFAPGWTLEAAAEICRVPNPATLGSLLDKNLIQPLQSDDTPAFRMLEIMRAYALTRFPDDSEPEDIRRRHAQYYLALAERTIMEFTGPSQLACIRKLKSAHPNLQTALQWTIKHGELEMGLSFCAALWRFWKVNGYFAEAKLYMETTLAQTAQVNIPQRASALFGFGLFLYEWGDFNRAKSCFEEGLRLARELDDNVHIAFLLHGAAEIALHEGDLDRAVVLAEDSVRRFEQLDNPIELGFSLTYLARAAAHRGELTQAKTLFERVHALFQTNGFILGLANINIPLSLILTHTGKTDRAIQLANEGLDFCEQLNHTTYIIGLTACLGLAMLKQNDIDAAKTAYAHGLSVARKTGDTLHVTDCLEGAAYLAGRQHRREAAVRLYAAAQHLNVTMNTPFFEFSRTIHWAMLTGLREKLGETLFKEIHKEGAAMDLEQAICYGLAEMGMFQKH
ncbi:MAG TPA: NB-ARC domain-containing protein [Gammaproteobacteria bacterium]